MRPARRALPLALLLLLALPAAPQNMALAVDGNDSALFVPRHASLEPPEALTLEAWVKGEGSVSHGRIVRKALGPGYMLSWSFQAGAVSGLVYCDGFKVAYDALPNTTYQGNWHHFAMTAEKDGLIRLYVDGELAGTEPAPTGCLTHSGDLWFGAFNGALEEFIGEIDEVRFWNVARTAEQIRDAMFLRLDHGPGLVSSWHLDGDGDDATSDNHGSLFGGAVFVPSTAPLSFAIEPRHGDWRGGSEVTLTGDFSRLSPAASVTFGGLPAAAVNVIDGSTITALAPAARQPGLAVPVAVSDPASDLVAAWPFALTPRLLAFPAAGPGQPVSVQLQLEPPALAVVLLGRPAPAPVALASVDWFLELGTFGRIFTALAPVQTSLAFELPAAGALAAAGSVLRLQAYVAPLPLGSQTPTFSNGVDLIVR